MKISVIVPVYNVAPFVRECLNSIIGQTFSDWEAICIDDGSVDGCGDILDGYARDDTRIKVIHQPNAGVSAARNVGLNVARGEWIAFLDGDDVWAPWTLSEVLKVIRSYADVDIVAFNTERFPEKGPYPWKERVIRSEYRVSMLAHFVDSGDVSFCFAGKIYRRDVIESVRFKSLAFGEDILFLLSCCLRAQMQVVVEATFYGYRQRTGSAIQSPIRKKRVLDRIIYMTEGLTLIEESPRKIGKNLLRGYGNGLSEVFMHEFLKLPMSDRSEVWEAWLAALPRIVRCHKLSLFQKMRFCFLKVCPSQMVACVLCWWPYLLKAKGFHR